jgi:uncharacterized NAD(P)/FAD-binding protein YdhS
MRADHVAVIGAGASGAIQALHLLKAGIGRVTLIERARMPGRGVAYSTARPEHLLNVHARRMSPFVDDPGHFARWFVARGGHEEGFAPRMAYGEYLAGLIATAGDGLEIVRGEAVDVAPGERICLADGRTIAADAVILAPGNFPPATPPGIDPAALGALWIGDPWAGGMPAGLGDDETILLVGTGLTAVDVAMTLETTGYRGRIIALSRRGLLPRPHGPHEENAAPAIGLPKSCAALVRHVRAQGRELGWRGAVHALRPVTQALWMAADMAERRRFLRHLRPWWDVHRHRIAPEIGTAIEAMRAGGRLEAIAGKLVSAQADGNMASVAYCPRGTGEMKHLRAARLINCTGPEMDISRSGDPLLTALLASGRLRPDPLRIGLDVDPACAAIDAEGRVSGSLSIIGPVTRGTFWETVAVPDIRIQADRIARRLASG